MLFKRTKNPQLKKSVSIYISYLHGQIIICPRHQNNAGIKYEQDLCSLLELPVDPSALGDEVLRNFHLYSLNDKNVRDQKRTDWPAFKFSTLKTVKSFEDSYFFVDISGNNESNLILTIEAPFTNYEGLFITSRTSSALTNKKEIGERIIQVFETASYRTNVKAQTIS